MGDKKIRENPRYGCAGSPSHTTPGRQAKIVLGHPEIVTVIANQVDARDVDAHAAGWNNTDRLTVKVLTRGNQAARDDSVAGDFLITIDVVAVHPKSFDTLGDTPLQSDAEITPRHQIRRKGPLLTRQRKRDALIYECAS